MVQRTTNKRKNNFNEIFAAMDLMMSGAVPFTIGSDFIMTHRDPYRGSGRFEEITIGMG